MKSKLEILNIDKTTEGLSATLLIEGNREVVDVFIGEDYRQYTVTDRIDAFVWGLLFFCMCKGYDIYSDIPITDELYYNLEFHFIDGLSQVNNSLTRIHVVAPLCKGIVGTHHIVSTGVSCGIDSLYTIAQHENAPADQKLNTLAFFNSGSSFRRKEKTLRSPLLEGRLENAKNFTIEAGKSFLFVESNIHLLIDKYLGYSHVENNTYMALFCIYNIQGAIKNYYYSSGYSYAEFTILREGHNAELDSEHYDLLILQMASINGMKFYSTGGNLNRFEKTRVVAKYKLSNKYLNVCVNEAHNDSTCFKCARTLLTLDALGVVDNYREVFDVNYYHLHRTEYIKNMYIEATFKHNSFYKEIIPSFKRELTVSLKLSAIFGKVVSVARNRLLHK